MVSDVVRTARAGARDEITAAIVASARRQLAEVGAADLSLRAVARDLGMVSSAVYRYVRSRDELLTLLIVAVYDELGDEADAAIASVSGHRERWLAAARAVRRWAIGHPHEYALVYGTPVPGYAAPDLTSTAGTRVSRALVAIVADAYRDGALARQRRRRSPDAEVTDPQLATDLDALAALIDFPGPPTLLVAAIAAWTQLFGLVSFEVFGQTRGLVEHHEALFDATAALMADTIGL
jgi:AcrR family transcriptional regulator